MPRPNKHQGFSLIELIIALVLLSIAVGAILSSLGANTVRNVDPQLRYQAMAIAEAMLNEAQSKAFYPRNEDPNYTPGVTDPDACPTASHTEPRNTWDYVCAYNLYSSQTITAPDGSAIGGLTGYSVQIAVTAQDTQAPLDGGSATSSVCAPWLRIAVTVTDPLDNRVQLVGYRASYLAPGAGGCS